VLTARGQDGGRDLPGVTFRALSTVFQQVAERSSQCQWAVNVVVMEIYNEAIRDLLIPPEEEAAKK
jgi:hypothetical protein